MNHIDIEERPRTCTPFPLEKQMASVCTKAIFLLFQKEYENSGHYMCYMKSESDCCKWYKVRRYEKD